MVDTPDLEKLAQRYLDLWQDQLTGIAADPEIAQTMARTLELMNSGVQAFAAQTGLGNVPGGRPGKDGSPPKAHDANAKPDFEATSGSGPSGPKAAAPSSRAANPDLDEFARRLDDIEQRLARLEAKPQKPGGGSAKKSRRRKS